jgi:predicted permease
MRRFFRRGRLDAERAREMQVHIDHHVDDLIAAGYSRDRALKEARRRFGNPTAIREEIYEMNSVPVLEPFVRDLRYAIRMLRKTPGFTAIALTTLAVAIGVNTAIFTVVNALLIKPLPFPDPGRLVTIRNTIRSPRGTFVRMSGLDGRTFKAILDNVKTMDVAIQGSGGWGGGVNLVAQNQAANVTQARVSAGYFKVFGIAPLIGREFTADEDRRGGPAVAVLSHALWSRLFDRDSAAVGRTILLRGESYTVVGVMPAGFTTGSPVDVWTPVRPNTSGEGGGTNYSLYARVHPGVSIEQASAEMNQVVAPLLIPSDPKAAAVTTAASAVVPLQFAETNELRNPLLMLWGAVGIVLVIACVNLAGLLIARTAMRAREIATRMALGSGRRAVIRQLLVESAALALAGGIAGIGVGWLVLEALKQLGTHVFDVNYPISLDGRVLATTLGIALATSLLFGLAPAIYASRVNVQGSLSEAGTRSVAGGAGRWSRRILVVAEVALGVVLLVSAGLLVRTFVHLRSLNPGFDPSHVTTAMVSLQDKRYEDAVKVNQLFEESLARIRQQPGVEAAGITLGLPYTRLLNMGWRRIEGFDPSEQWLGTNVSYVTPGYVEALRLPLRRGRAFTDRDRDGATPVVIVNQEFARKYYKGADIVGMHIRVAGADREIVGIVGNARATSSGLGGDSGPLIVPFVVYVPAAQVSGDFLRQVHTWFSPTWVIRSSAPTGTVVEAIRRSMAGVDPLLPIAKIESMSEVQSASLASQRFTMSLVAGLGLVALMLAAIGIHGLISSSVTERKRELGIRLALGATARQVIVNVVSPGVTLAAIGVVIGCGAALALSTLMRSFIWGVQPTDPVTFASVAAILLAVSLAASLIPALRVLRLDPALTLRAE